MPAQPLTLAGNAGCAIAAWNVVETGKAIEAAEREKAREAAVSAAKKMDDDARKKTRLGFGGLEDAARRFVRRRRFGAGGSNASAASASLALEPDPVPPPLNPLAWAPPPSLGSSAALAAWTVAASVAVKEGELFLPGSAGPGSSFFLEPTLAKALACVALPTAAVAAVVFTACGDAGAEEQNDEKKLSMEDVRSFGAAGTAAYVLVELAFWAVAFPAAFAWHASRRGRGWTSATRGIRRGCWGPGRCSSTRAGARAAQARRRARVGAESQSSDAFGGVFSSSERSAGETDEDES